MYDGSKVENWRNKVVVYGIEISPCGCGNKSPEIEHIYPDHDIFVRVKCNCGMNSDGAFRSVLQSAASLWNEIQEKAANE